MCGKAGKNENVHFTIFLPRPQLERIFPISQWNIGGETSSSESQKARLLRLDIISKYHSIIFAPFTKSLGKKVKLAILLLLFI